MNFLDFPAHKNRYTVYVYPRYIQIYSIYPRRHVHMSKKLLPISYSNYTKCLLDIYCSLSVLLYFVCVLQLHHLVLLRFQDLRRWKSRKFGLQTLAGIKKRQNKKNICFNLYTCPPEREYFEKLNSSDSDNGNGFVKLP